MCTRQLEAQDDTIAWAEYKAMKSNTTSLLPMHRVQLCRTFCSIDAAYLRPLQKASSNSWLWARDFKAWQKRGVCNQAAVFDCFYSVGTEALAHLSNESGH